MKKKARSNLLLNDHSDPNKYNDSNTISSNYTKKNINKEESHTPPKLEEINTNIEPWICKACTYLNKNYSSLCEICGVNKFSTKSNIEDDITVHDLDHQKYPSACIECGQLLKPPNYLCKCDENKCIKCKRYYFDCICFDETTNKLKTMGEHKDDDSDYEIKTKPEVDKSDNIFKEWTCKACQYYNRTFYDTCNMCDLPKDSDDIDKIRKDQEKTMEILKKWEQPDIENNRRRERVNRKNLKRQISFRVIHNMLDKIEQKILYFKEKEPPELTEEEMEDLLDISNRMSDVHAKIAFVLAHNKVEQPRKKEDYRLKYYSS